MGQQTNPILLLLWFMMGLFGIDGLFSLIYGLLYSRKKRVGRRRSRLLLMSLIKWGVFTEEDLNQAWSEPAPAPVPTADVSPPSVQNWRDRILDGSPAIQQVILNWERPWGYASIFAGIGILLACGITILVIVPLSGRSIGPPGDLGALLAYTDFLTALMIYLPIIGCFTGFGLGVVVGAFKMAHSGQRAAPERQTRKVSDYRSCKLLWLLAILFSAAFALTLSASSSAPVRLDLLITRLAIVPLLALGLILLSEYLISRLTRLPPLQLSADSALAERANIQIFPRLMQIVFGLEYGVVGMMVIVQSMLITPDVFPERAWLIDIPWGLAVLCFLLWLWIVLSHGRLGGRLTGWPWSKHGGAATSAAEGNNALQSM